MELKIIDVKILERIKKELVSILEKSNRFKFRKQVGWLDSYDVCELLHISQRTLQTYRNKGVLAFSQIGHKFYYKRQDIDKLIEQHKIEL